MARSNIGIDELQKMLEKSGLPMGDSFVMRQGQVGAQQALQGTGGDHGAGGAMQSYKAKLAQIAQMDQKLAGVYGDPTSPLYIEHAGARDNAASSARGTGMSELSSIEQRRQAALSQQDADESEAVQLYGQLENAQRELEAEQKRLTKEAEKAAKKAGKGTGTGKGNITTVFGKLTAGEKRLANQVGIDTSDTAALSEFFNKSPSGFQKYLADEALDGKVKQEGWNAKQIKEQRKKYEQIIAKDKEAKAAAKKKTTTKSGGDESMESLMKQYAEVKKKK